MFACYVVKPKLMLDDGNNEMAACVRACGCTVVHTVKC